MDIEECVKEWEDLLVDYKRLEVWDSQIVKLPLSYHFLVISCKSIPVNVMLVPLSASLFTALYS